MNYLNIIYETIQLMQNCVRSTFQNEMELINKGGRKILNNTSDLKKIQEAVICLKNHPFKDYVEVNLEYKKMYISIN